MFSVSVQKGANPQPCGRECNSERGNSRDGRRALARSNQITDSELERRVRFTFMEPGALPDHLVRTQEQRSRHGHAKRLRRLEIDPEEKLRRLLDRKISGFRAAQHFVE